MLVNNLGYNVVYFPGAGLVVPLLFSSGGGRLALASAEISLVLRASQLS